MLRGGIGLTWRQPQLKRLYTDLLGQMIVRECNGADPELVLEAHEAHIMVPPEVSSG